jgi:hypothetical protein
LKKQSLHKLIAGDGSRGRLKRWNRAPFKLWVDSIQLWVNCMQPHHVALLQARVLKPNEAPGGHRGVGGTS